MPVDWKRIFQKGDWKAIDERLVNHDQIGSFMWFLTFLKLIPTWGTGPIRRIFFRWLETA